MPQLSKKDRRDLSDLAICLLSLVAGWLLLGWRPGWTLFRQDALQYVYPAFSVIREAGQGLNGPAYDPFWLGGVKFSSVWITPWFAKVFLLLKLRIVDAISLSLMTSQIFQGFLSVKLMDALLAWRKAEPCESRNERILWIFLFTFFPVLANRLTAGHFFYPSLFPLALLALLLGVKLRSFGSLGFLGCAGILITCFETQTYPQLAYAAVFGLPLLLYFAYSLRPWTKLETTLLLGLGMAACGWSLRGHLDSLVHYLGTDASRQAGGKELVYSFGLPTVQDWINSLFWDPRAWARSANWNFWMETNYPLGALLAPLLLAFRTRLRTPMLVLTALLATAALFAADVSPVSDLILAAVPPFRYFRVPMRALFPLFVLLPPFAAAALDYKGLPRKSWLLAGTLAAAAPFLLPPLPREILLFALALGALFTGYYLRLRPVLIGALLVGSTFAFQLRLPQMADLRLSEVRTRELRSQILALDPRLVSPFERVALAFRDDKFAFNTGRVLGLSTLDGYWQPNRRFTEIVYEAFHLPVDQLALNYHLPPGFPQTEHLITLYGVTRSVAITDSGNPELKEVGPRREWARLYDPQAPGQPCRGRSIESAEVTDPFFALRFRISAGPPCLLFVAANFAENLRASSPEAELTTLPLFGALLGVALPPEARNVEVRAERFAPGWLAVLSLFSLICLLSCAHLYRRRELAS